MSIKISIIMGIYNCADTLSEAIDSILMQTEQNWELIMCDDGSKDTTFEVAQTYANKYPGKIKVIRNEHNIGLNATLNHCLEHATGEYIARMDGDDISLPMRFEKELRFLEEHPEFSVVSTPMVMFDENGNWGCTTVIERPQINDFCLHSPFFCHAASMIRMDVIKSVGGYTEDSRFLRVEDCNLWFKVYAAGYRGANIDIPLYKMRDDRNATGRRNTQARVNGCYVMFDGFRRLNMPWYKYYYVIRNAVIELIKCLIPPLLYEKMHRRNYRRMEE